MSQNSSFSKFGSTYQTKVITGLFYDKLFVVQVTDILKPEYFDNPACEWIVKKITAYYAQYKTTPTLDVFRVYLEEIEDDVSLKTAVVDTLKNVVAYRNSEDIAFIKDDVLKFCKNQVMKLAIIESAKELENENYDAIRDIIGKALQAGTGVIVGHDYKAQVPDRYNEEIRNPIATPWITINQMTAGGLGGGELGLIVAPMGVGKSWILQNIGLQALLDGKNVLHYTLELSAEYTGKRYDAILTGIPFTQLKEEDASPAMENVAGQLMIVRYPAQRATVATLDAHIQRSIANGFRPDLVIVDYLDELAPGRHFKESHEGQAAVAADLRALAIEMDIPVWSATQGTKGSIRSNQIDSDEMGGSVRKGQIADFMMSVTRREDDKLQGRAKFFIMKSRLGGDGHQLAADFDADNGRINILDINSPRSRAILSENKMSEAEKKEAERQKLKQFFERRINK